MTQRLHEDEVHINVGLVRELIRTQLPQLGDLQLQLVAAPGTDNPQLHEPLREYLALVVEPNIARICAK